jgi:regulator of protease activity HflC (stomatin/prohibitin superfamily)
MAVTSIFRNGNPSSGGGGPGLPIRSIAIWVGIAILALLVLSFAGCGIKIVDTGQRGIETRFGKVVGESKPEGIYFYNPITSTMVEMDTRVQRKDGETDTYTRDVQQAGIKYTLNYRLQQDAAHIMYRDVGRDWDDKLVPQVVLGTLKEVVGKWDAVDLIANRDKAGATAFEAIRQNLAERNVEVSRFEIVHERVRAVGRAEGHRAAEGHRRAEPHQADRGAGAPEGAVGRGGSQVHPDPRSGARAQCQARGVGSGAEVERRAAAVHAGQRRDSVHQPDAEQGLKTP